MAAKQTPKRPLHVFQSFFLAIPICSLLRLRLRLRQRHFCTNTTFGAKNTARVMEGRHGTRKSFLNRVRQWKSRVQRVQSPEKLKRWRVYSQLAEQSQTWTPLGLCAAWQGVTARERRQSSFCQLQDPLTAGETTVARAAASGAQSGGGVKDGRVNSAEGKLYASLQNRKLWVKEARTALLSFSKDILFIGPEPLLFIQGEENRCTIHIHRSINLRYELTGRMIWFCSSKVPTGLSHVCDDLFGWKNGIVKQWRSFSCLREKFSQDCCHRLLWCHGGH